MSTIRKSNKDKTAMLLDVIFRSATGRSILEERPNESKRDYSRYEATKETRDEAVKALRDLGFKLAGPPSPYGVSIVGTPHLVHRVFGKEPFIVPKSLAKWIESVRVPPPGEFYKTSI